MEEALKKVFRRVVPRFIPAALPDFELYKATKVELERFRGNAVAFRKEKADPTAVYLVFAPGPARERSYTVHLGWSFVAGIAPFDYWEQRRELGSIRPHRKFDSGFEQLQVIEEESVVLGEEIPRGSELPGSRSWEIEAECLMQDSLESVASRIRRVLPKIEGFIATELPRRSR